MYSVCLARAVEEADDRVPVWSVLLVRRVGRPAQVWKEKDDLRFAAFTELIVPTMTGGVSLSARSPPAR